MANHFTSLGFPIETEEEYHQLVADAAENGTEYATTDGVYLQWTVETGAELWVHVNLENQVTGLEPHFAGVSRMRVRVDHPIIASEEYLMEGGFYAWSEPSKEEGAESPGLFPFVFSTPDFQVHAERSLPSLMDVQLVGFAHELEAFTTEQAYYDSQQSDIKFAAESFIPSGLFVQPDASGNRSSPEPYGMVTGHVKESALIENARTGVSFWWARIQTAGGEIEIVADPETLVGELMPGGVIRGSFWLSGRVFPATG